MYILVDIAPEENYTRYATVVGPGVSTEKPKVHQFQICCVRTKYLSEIHKSQATILHAYRATFGQFVLNCVRNLVQVTFEASL